MSTTQRELLRTLTSTNQQTPNNLNSSEQLVNRIPVENTGFWIIGDKDHGYFISLGAYRLTETRQTEEECREMIENKDWEIILGLIGAQSLAHETQYHPTGRELEMKIKRDLKELEQLKKEGKEK